MNTLQLCSKNTDLSFESSKLLSVLQTVSKAKSEKKWFKDYENQLSSTFEGRYYGTETDFAAIKQSLDNAVEITETFPYFTVPEDTISALINITENMQLSGKARRISEMLSDKALDSVGNTLYESHFIADFHDESDMSDFVITQINDFWIVVTTNVST